MRTIARINSDGSILIKGEVYQLIPAWDDTEDIDDIFTIDEDTEIDDNIPFEDFMKILIGINSQEIEVDGVCFDNRGNLFARMIIESMVGFDLTNKSFTSNIIDTTKVFIKSESPVNIIKYLFSIDEIQVDTKGLKFKDGKSVYTKELIEGADFGE